MSKKFEAQILDLGGGLDDSIDPSSLNARFSPILRNFYPYGPHLRRRPGIILQNSTPATERVTGLFAYGKQVGSWILIIGSRSGLNQLSSGLVLPLPNLDGVTIPASDDVWRMAQYKGVGYAVRVGVSGLLRFTETGYSRAGIVSPVAAPTIAAAGGGVMEAGDRYVVQTYFNVDTDVESNPSAASAVATLGALGKITISAAGVSTNPQVTGRRFYVTLPNIQGQYYLALQVDENTNAGLPYTINKSIDQLGGLASFKNAPPDQLEYVSAAIFKERLWITDGFDIKFSQNIAGIGLAECFSATDFIEINPDDRNHVTVLLAVGERLIVGRSNGISAILASGSSFEVQSISDRQGCPAGGSMKTAEGYFYWYSGENVYRSNGGNPECISDPTTSFLGASGSRDASRIRALLDSIPDAYKSKVEAAIHPRLGWYILSIPTGSSTIPTTAAIYDYRRQRWFMWDHATLGAPTVFGDFLDSLEQPRVYCAFNGANNVYDFMGTPATLRDDGVSIQAEWRSAGADCGAPGYEHVVTHGGILIDPINAVCNLYAFEDGSLVPSVSRMGFSLSSARQVMRASLPSVRSFYTQIGITYSGDPVLVLKGVSLEADVWGFKEEPE